EIGFERLVARVRKGAGTQRQSPWLAATHHRKLVGLESAAAVDGATTHVVEGEVPALFHQPRARQRDRSSHHTWPRRLHERQREVEGNRRETAGLDVVERFA